FDVLVRFEISDSEAPMERTNFEKLDVYRLSEKLAHDVWNIVIAWDTFARDTVGKQIVRAADSIGANIAEGSGHVEVLSIIGDLYGWRVAHYMKPSTGCAAHIRESF